MCFFLFPFEIHKKVKGKVFDPCKTNERVKAVFPLKFMSLGCTIVIFRSKTLLYVSTPQRLGFEDRRIYCGMTGLTYDGLRRLVRHYYVREYVNLGSVDRDEESVCGKSCFFVT